MTERGVFAVDRGIWDHPRFQEHRPYSRREAFLWLVSEAAFKRRRVAVGAIVVELHRGQLAHSLRFMGRAWRWPEARVRRFLECLKTDAMIDAASDAGRTIVSICNYDRYQWNAGDTDAATDAPSDARSTQHRRKLEECNNDLKKEGSPSAALSPGKPNRSRSLAPREYTLAFETFWAGYPKTKTSNPKAVAFDVFEKLSAADQDTATASLPAFRDWVSGQFKGYQAPGASVYLRQRRFDDLAPVTTGSPADPEKVLAGQRTMARLFFSGEWHPNWGAPPGEPGCTIPDDLIAEVANASGALWPIDLRAQA